MRNVIGPLVVAALGSGLVFGLTGCSSQAAQTGSSSANVDTVGYDALNLAAGSMVLYEMQPRTANACQPGVGSADQQTACTNKIAPTIPYRQQGQSCNIESDLAQIKLGTFDDMLEDTSDYRQGITVRYINEKVGANTIWVMPIFPNNMQYNVPDACDNLGSPYAVTDYFHAQGTLTNACISQGADEYSTTPCWGNAGFESVIAAAHAKGMKVMLDMAFNHFGHQYNMYDYGDYTPIRERIAQNQDLSTLWNFDSTYEATLLHPVILDTPATLTQLAASSTFHQGNLTALQAKCPSLTGDSLVRAYNMWREGFDWDRTNFNCTNIALEYEDPGFYLGADSFNPSTKLGDNFTNNWSDVKFIFHHEENTAHQEEFVREREYLFRVMNYWVSRGVDAFRLDHTTDPNGGMGSNEWKYITTKTDYYASKRGQANPVYLAEEFNEQGEMNKVVDVMTDGYVGNMTGRSVTNKDANFVNANISNNDRFDGHAFVMTALETHDERRLIDGTGFDIFTGAGFWAMGAATRSTPMMLMGQEFGEAWGLGFKRSDYLRSRFVGTAQYQAQGDTLAAYYHTLISSRLDNLNRALVAPHYSFLQTKTGNTTDGRIFAMAKWSDDGNVVFVFNNLWAQDVSQDYFISADVAGQMNISDTTNYMLVDAISGTQQGACQTGANLKWDLFVSMPAATRAQWLRLQECTN
jgi:glycosidase